MEVGGGSGAKVPGVEEGRKEGEGKLPKEGDSW